MTTAVQRRRGTNTEHASFTGLEGELSVNTTNESVHVHDGSTAGGFELARADASNIVATSIDINGGTIDGTAIGASSASTGAFTTLTATGLTVDTNTLYVDSTNNRVGVGTTSPASTFEIAKNDQTNGATLSITNSYNSSGWDAGDIIGSIDFRTDDTSTTQPIRGQIKLFEDSASGTTYANSNAMSFSTGRNDTLNERMRIDSSGNVGIGTSSPSSKLHLSGDGDSASKLTVQRTGATTGTVSLGYNYVGSFSNNDFKFYTNSAEAMRIDSSGNVSIGTTANYSNRLYIQSDATGSLPTNQLIQQNDSNVITVKNGNNSATYSGIKLETRTTGASGWLIANEWKSTYLGDLVFKVRDAGTSSAERMRLDSSGNVLVGKTSTGTNTAGSQLNADGLLTATRNGNYASILTRLNSDGQILQFRKDGSTVGSIGASGGDLYIGTGDTALRFFDGSDFIYPVSTATGTARDNAIDLGYSTGRFDDIYATNGTIQTSDRNEKQDIAELSEAEQRVAVACKGLLRKFRWKDSVAEKGDDARIHFGIIAQDLQAAFEAEGLDAGDYAMFISTTWTDEETNEEKTRMGVRYSELLAFIISAI